jgi:hypothetical protein
LELHVGGVEWVRSTGRACAGPGHQGIIRGNSDCPGPWARPMATPSSNN